MRRRTAFLLGALVGGLSAPLVVGAQAPDPWIGTWVLNVAKSKYSPGPAPKSNTIRIEASDGRIKYTTDGVGAEGQATHTEFTVKFDGKPYPVTGNPDVDTYAARRLGARRYELVARKGGKVTTTSRIVVSADGKTRTVTATGKNPQGQAVNNTIVYDKQ